MTHKPIVFQQTSFVLPHKTCFSDVSETIHYGQRVAVIGKNGAGKSSLLRMLTQDLVPSSGSILMPSDACVSFVGQIADLDNPESGGEQFNRRLNKALALCPNVLILDEPTNHLDQKNRTSLLRMLHKFPHTLIVASHDEELLNQLHFDRIIAFVDGGKVVAFSGSYEDYLDYYRQASSALLKNVALLNKEIARNHQALMQEQKRAKESRRMGEKGIANKKWPTIVSKAKAGRAQTTTGNKKAGLANKKEELVERLSELHRPEIIVPKFYFSSNVGKSGSLLSVFDGAVGFGDQKILSDINLCVNVGERIAINGENGSGKSTLFKAIVGDDRVQKSGTWHLLPPGEVGYLDQHYHNLDEQLTPFEIIEKRRPDFGLRDIREHLNEFLFRKNEEVHGKVRFLSGGERLRLSLCQIAAKAPRLLLLDEVTNNVDRETKEHLVTVIRSFPGAIMLISHDAGFLDKACVEKTYSIEDGLFCSSP